MVEIDWVLVIPLMLFIAFGLGYILGGGTDGQ